MECAGTVQAKEHHGVGCGDPDSLASLRRDLSSMKEMYMVQLNVVEAAEEQEEKRMLLPEEEDAAPLPHEAYPLAAMIIILTVTILQSYGQSGMQAVLELYGEDGLGLSGTASTIVVSGFVAIYSFMAPVGGLVSDRWLGNYLTQWGSSWYWLAGAVIIQWTVIGLNHTLSVMLAVLGLSLTAFGYGLINPIQSIFVGDQFGPSQTKQKIAAFSWYYFCCNVGNVFGEAVCPLLRQYTSWNLTLMTITATLLPACLIFWAGSRFYVKVLPTMQKRRPGEDRGWSTKKEDLESLWRILPIFAPFPVFWALYFQQSSTWIIQADEMNLYLGSFYVPPDLMPSLNDLMVLILLPVFGYLVYPFCDNVLGFKSTPLRKLAAGMVMTVLAFVCATLLQVILDHSEEYTVSIFLQFPQYFFISAAEVLVAVTGLEFCYSQSPVSMKSTVTALWYIATALGQLIVIAVELIPFSNPATAFAIFTTLMIIVTLVFIVISLFYKYADYNALSANDIESRPGERLDLGHPDDVLVGDFN